MVIATETISLPEADEVQEYRNFLDDLTVGLWRTGYSVRLLRLTLPSACTIGQLLDQLIVCSDQIATFLSYGNFVIVDGCLLASWSCLARQGRRWAGLLRHMLEELIQPDVYVLYDLPTGSAISRQQLFNLSLQVEKPLFVYTPEQRIEQVLWFILDYQKGVDLCPLPRLNGMRSQPLVSA